MTDDIAATYHQKFNKPMYVGEFGTDGGGANSKSDPHRRGLQQSLWGGIFGGSAGTAMPWWWENIHDENLYPLWRSLRDFLPADFGNEKMAAARHATSPRKTRFWARLKLAARLSRNKSLCAINGAARRAAR